MMPDIYWVRAIAPLRLALMPRPRPGDWLREEVAGWRAAGIATVVSLLEAHEARELDLVQEPALCEEHGMSFLSFPIPDRGTPASINATAQLVAQLQAQLRDGKAVALHCRAGIGRTGLIGACTLLGLGVALADVFAVLSQARKLTMPDTQAQVEWVARFHAATAQSQ